MELRGIQLLNARDAWARNKSIGMTPLQFCLLEFNFLRTLKLYKIISYKFPINVEPGYIQGF